MPSARRNVSTGSKTAQRACRRLAEASRQLGLVRRWRRSIQTTRASRRLNSRVRRGAGWARSVHASDARSDEGGREAEVESAGRRELWMDRLAAGDASDCWRTETRSAPPRLPRSRGARSLSQRASDDAYSYSSGISTLHATRQRSDRELKRQRTSSSHSARRSPWARRLRSDAAWPLRRARARCAAAWAVIGGAREYGGRTRAAPPC